MLRYAPYARKPSHDAAVRERDTPFLHASVIGKRVLRSAKLLLDQLDLSGAVLPHFGQTAAEQQEALSRLQIQQMEGGQHHGMYVAKDAVAKLTGILDRNASGKLKTMMDAPANKARFPSRINMSSGHANVSFTQRFSTTSTNCTKSESSDLVLIFNEPNFRCFFLYLVLTFATR